MMLFFRSELLGLNNTLPQLQGRQGHPCWGIPGTSAAGRSVHSCHLDLFQALTDLPRSPSVAQIGSALC